MSKLYKQLVKLSNSNNVTEIETLFRQNTRSTDSKQKSLALFHAIINKRLDIVRILALHETNLNCRNFHGDTPMHIAVINNDINTVNFLIANKVDLNLISKSGYTPLNLAIHKDFTEVKDILLENGADITIDEVFDHPFLYNSETQECELCHETKPGKFYTYSLILHTDSSRGYIRSYSYSLECSGETFICEKCGKNRHLKFLLILFGKWLVLYLFIISLFDSETKRQIYAYILAFLPTFAGVVWLGENRDSYLEILAGKIEIRKDKRYKCLKAYSLKACQKLFNKEK